MRRHETQSSAADGRGARSRSGGPGAPAQTAGNRALAGLLAPRAVQRSPAGGTPFVPEEIDYYNLKRPKSLDRGFRPPGSDTGPADAGFTAPARGGSGMDLGYGGTGDEGFRPDYHAHGGRHGSDPGLAGALQGRDPLGGSLNLPDDLPIPPAGLPVPGGETTPDLGGAALDIGASVSAFARELPFVQDLL